MGMIPPLLFVVVVTTGVVIDVGRDETGCNMTLDVTSVALDADFENGIDVDAGVVAGIGQGAAVPKEDIPPLGTAAVED